MKKDQSSSGSVRPAILFDLDGTLIDSVYQHVLAWREALERAGIQLAVWRIHRRIGMSGGLLVNALLRETGREITSSDAQQLLKWHAEAYAKMVAQVRPLPGSVELLAHRGKGEVRNRHERDAGRRAPIA
jgi:beta-phosphoglucomutase-like phosphatase (HAD superfamily)